MAPLQSNNKHLMYKNKLQAYTQKSGLPLPMYQTINEGFPHAPKFRSTVLVNGTSYTSKSEYHCQRSAEQEAAKIAFESITAKSNDEGCPLINKNPIYCKSIIHEYAVKMNFNKPEYNTTCASGKSPTFISSLDLNGKTFTGEIARSKKEAEQLVARTAIKSFLGSDSGTLVQIIKSKKRLFLSLPARKKPMVGEGVSPIAVHPENSLCQQANSVHGAIVTFGSAGTSGARAGAKRKAENNIWQQKIGPKKKLGAEF